MRRTFICILCLFFSFHSIGQTNTKGVESEVHESKKYKFKVSVPKDWVGLSGLVWHDDSLMTELCWGIIPSEKQPENTISIRAYKRVSITSIRELMEVTYRPFDMKEFQVEADKNNNAQILTNNMRKYKAKYYFLMKNGISYVVIYRSKMEQYDANLPVFEKFYKSIKFL